MHGEKVCFLSKYNPCSSGGGGSGQNVGSIRLQFASISRDDDLHKYITSREI